MDWKNNNNVNEEEIRKGKSTFFCFDRVMYSKEKNKVEISNFEKEKQKAIDFVDKKIEEIDKTDDVLSKRDKCILFDRTIKKMVKELDATKKNIRDEFTKEICDNLSALSKYLNEHIEMVKDDVSEALMKAGETDVFYTPVKFKIETTPIVDPKKVQEVILTLYMLGVGSNLYINDKKAKEKDLSELGIKLKFDEKESEDEKVSC